jgi:glycogen operon protein
MRPEDWDAPLGRSVGVYLNGEGIRQRDARGEPITDVDFLLFYNAEPDVTEFTIPPRTRQRWEVVIDTAGLATDSELRRGGDAIALEGRSMLVLRAHSELETEPDHAVAASLAVRPTGQGAQANPATPGTPGTSGGAPSTKSGTGA